MPENPIVVSNTTPIYYLHAIGRLELLQHLYGRLIVPVHVVAELDAGADEGAPNVRAVSWMDIRPVRVPEALRLVPDLGGGEAGAMALAMELGQDTLVILDDKLGRRIAGLQGIRITGTAGVLLKAKRQGLVPSVGPMLDAMLRAGFHLSQRVVRDTLALAGE